MAFYYEDAAIAAEEEKKKPPPTGKWMDPVILLGKSAAEYAGSVASGLRFAAGKAGYTNLEKGFKGLAGLSDEAAKGYEREISPVQKEALQGLEGLAKHPARAIGGHIVQSAAEMGATVGAGAIGSLAGPPGTIAGLVGAGAGSAASRMIDEMYSLVDNATEADLNKYAPYAKRRAAGYSPEASRRWLINKMYDESNVGSAATIYGLMNIVGGVEAAATNLLTGVTKQSAGKQIGAFAKRVGRLGGEEAVQETAQSAVEDIVSQQQRVAIGAQKAYDPRQTARAGFEGGVIGGITGGALGAPIAAVEARRAAKQPKPGVPDDIKAAIDASNNTTRQPTPDPVTVESIPKVAQAAAQQVQQQQQQAQQAAQQPAPLPPQVTPTQTVPVPAPAPAAAAVEPTPAPAPVTPPVTPAPKVSEEDFINNADLPDDEEGEIITPLPAEVTPAPEPVISKAKTEQTEPAKPKAKKAKAKVTELPPPPAGQEGVAITPEPEPKKPVVKPPAFVKPVESKAEIPEETKPKPEPEKPAVVEAEPVSQAPVTPAPTVTPSKQPAFVRPKKPKVLLDTTARSFKTMQEVRDEEVQEATTAKKRAVPKGEIITDDELRRGDNQLRAFETKMAKGESADPTGKRAALTAALVEKRRTVDKGEAIRINVALKKMAREEAADQKVAREAKEKAKTEEKAKAKANIPAPQKMAKIANDFSPVPAELRANVPIKTRTFLFMTRLKNIVGALDEENVGDSNPFVAGARSLYGQVTRGEREITEADIKQLNALQDKAMRPQGTAISEAARQAEIAAISENVAARGQAGRKKKTETEEETEGAPAEAVPEITAEGITQESELTEEQRTSEAIEAKHGKTSSRGGPVRSVGETKTHVEGGEKVPVIVRGEVVGEITRGGRNVETVHPGRRFTAEELAKYKAENDIKRRQDYLPRYVTDINDYIEDGLLFSHTKGAINLKSLVPDPTGPQHGKRVQRHTVKPLGVSTVGEILGNTSFVRAVAAFLPGMKALPRAMITKMLQRISDGTLNETSHVKVYLISDEDMRRVSPGQFPGFTTTAFYDPTLDVIVISEQMLGAGGFETTVLHEAIHAAYVQYVNNSPKAKKEIELLYDHIVRNYAKEFKKDERLSYSLNDLHEFITEALSNPYLQSRLAAIKLPRALNKSLRVSIGQPINALKAFIRMVAEAIGVNYTTVLDAVLTIGGRLESRAYPGYIPTAVRAARGQLGAEDIAAIPDTGLVFRRQRTAPPTQGPPQQGGTWWHNPPAVARHLWLKGRQFDQLARDADPLFGGEEENQLRRVTDQIEKRRVLNQRIIDDGNVVVRKLMELEQRFPDEFKRFAALAFDATTANIHPDVLLDHFKNAFVGKDKARFWQAKARHADQHARWQALSPEFKQIWHEINTLTDRQNEMSEQLIDNLVEVALGKADKEMAKRIFEGTANDADWEQFKTNEVLRVINEAVELKRIEGFYIPLMREGDYVVRAQYDINKENLMGGTVIGDDVVQFLNPTPGKRGGKTKVRQMAEAFVGQSDLKHMGTQRLTVDPNDPTKQVPADDPNGIVAYRVKMQTEHMELKDSPAQAEEARRDLLDHPAIKKGSVKDVAKRRELSGERPEMLATAFRNIAEKIVTVRGKALDGELAAALREASIRTMGASRVQSRRLPRRFVKGHSDDLTHALSTYNISTAGYLAKLRTQPEIDKALRAAGDYIKAHETDGKTLKRTEYFNEAEKRVRDQNSRIPTPVDKKVDTILSIVQMDKLATGSYHIINGLQNATVTTQVLSGRHGPVATWREMGKAYKLTGAGDIAWAGLRDTVRAGKSEIGNALRWLGLTGKPGTKARIPIEVTDHLQNLRDKLAKAPNGDELLAMLDELDILIAPDASFEVGHLTGARSAAGQVIQRATFITRQLGQAVEAINRSTAAIAAFNLEYKKNGGDAEAATRYAKNIVQMTHFNYSQSNAPPFMSDRHPLMRIALQFKKYAQNMVYLMIKLGHTAISKENSPEVRREAAKSLAYTLGTTAAIAGVLGLPTEPFRMGVMLLGTLGFIDDDWEDVERWVEENFGNIAAHGLPNLFGVDLSTRTGLNNLLVYGQPGGDDRKSREAFMWGLIGGAPGSYAMDLAMSLDKPGSAANNYLAGNFSEGNQDMSDFMEKVIPVRALSDMISAFKMATEGKVNKKGEVITEPSIARAGLKALGFKSTTEAEDQRMVNRMYRDLRYRDKVRQDFFDRWKEATTADERQAIFAEVKAFNRTVPKEARVTWKSLQTAKKRAKKAKKVKGVYLGRDIDLAVGAQ